MDKVTVIIPAYNAESYIERCANSVLNQTLKELEIIFIDDGSTDSTSVMLDNLTKSRDNVRIIHQENRGLYRSREIGLSLATGEYIGWIDADDFVEPNMFEILYNAAVEHNSELVICDYTWFPKKIRTKGKWFREYSGTVDTTFIERNTQPWNKIVKRELMERLGVASLFSSCFDDIYVRILFEAKNPVTINNQLYHYRVCKGTMSTSYEDVDHYKQFKIASKELREVMQHVTKDPYWNEYFDYRVIYYMLMTMVVAAYSGDREEYDNSRLELLSIEPSYSDNQHYWRILKRNY